MGHNITAAVLSLVEGISDDIQIEVIPPDVTQPIPTALLLGLTGRRTRRMDPDRLAALTAQCKGPDFGGDEVR